MQVIKWGKGSLFVYVFKKYRFLLKNTGLWASKYRFVFPEVGMSDISMLRGFKVGEKALLHNFQNKKGLIL